MAYIYKITNDINEKIYIGKTESSIEKRFKEHCKDAFRDRNEKRPLYSAMRKYGIENFHIELIEETQCPEDREIYWIKYYNSYKTGYNATLGGDGKKYIDDILVISQYTDLKNQEEVAKKLNIDPQTVRNILRNNNIKIIKNPTKCKSVKQLDKNGVELNTFHSCGEAARYLYNNKYSEAKIGTITNKITECANNKRKTAYGFLWKFI